MREAKKVVWGVVLVLAVAWQADAQTTFNADPASLGAIPDSSDCVVAGTPRDVTFTVSGVSGPVVPAVSITLSHTFVGDLQATLFAPDGTSHVLFSLSGAVLDPFQQVIGLSAADLNGTYVFGDASAGNWWATLAAITGSGTVPSGSYRTSQAGDLPGGGALTTMTPAFATAQIDGTWTLRLVDMCNFDTGTVTASSLTLATIAAAGDTFATPYRTALTVAAPGVLGNDSPSAGLNASLVTSAAHGTVSLASDGSFTYTPAAGYAGADTFTYAPVIHATAATVTVNVAPPIVVGSGESYTTGYRTPLTIAAPGVLANDTTDAGTLTAVLHSGPAHGTLTLGADGSVLYTPAAGYSGSDSFTYQPAADGFAGPAALVTLSVSAPVMTTAPDNYATSYRAPVTVAAPGVLGNDTVNAGPLTAVLDAGPTNGVLSLNANGAFTYTSAAGFHGADSFTYHTMVDGIAGPGGVVHVAVAAPVMTGTSDSYTTAFQAALTVAAPGVLGNDSTDHGTLQTAQASQAAHGIVVVGSSGEFTYAPDAGYVGPDSFTYRVAVDGIVGPPVMVAVTVAPPSDPQPPTGLVTADISGGIVTMRWHPPVLGPAPSAYVIEGGYGPGQVLGSLTLSAAAPVLRVPAGPGVYFVRVRTQAGSSVSAPSSELRVVVGQDEVPTAPAALTALVDGTNLSLAWQNTFSGGEPAGLVLDATGAVIGSAPLMPGESFSAVDLPPGIYTLSMRAANAAGVSTPSAPVTVTVPSVCTGAPAMPVNFVAFVTNGQLGLLWDLPTTGAAAQGYLLTVGGDWAGTVPMTSRFAVVPVPSGIYTFSVQAVNACGSSTPTATQTVTIP